MRSNIYTSDVKSVSQLLRSEILNSTGIGVPVYQRPYTWNDEKVGQLFDDLLQHSDTDPNNPYYLGNLVFVQRDRDETLEVLDGQQRLTTLYLFTIALRQNLIYINDQIAKSSLDEYDKSRLLEDSNELAQLLLNHFRGKDGCYLQFHNSEDQRAFAHCGGTNYVNGVVPNGTSKKHKIIRACHLLFDLINNELDSRDSTSQTELQYFREQIGTIKSISQYVRGQHAEVTLTVINDGMEFTIFETLNSRGEQLNIYDLTRLILLNIGSLPHINQMSKTEKAFKTIADNCKNPSTKAPNLSNSKALILGTWNMRNPGKTSAGKYMKTFMEWVSDSDAIQYGGGFKRPNNHSVNNFHNTLNYLEVSSFGLKEILSPNEIQTDSCDIPGSKSEKTALSNQLRLFNHVGFKQYYPIYYALRNRAANATTISEYVRLIECLYVQMIFTFKRSPSEIEKNISDLGYEILNAESLVETLESHRGKIKSLIQKVDGDFQSAFAKSSVKKESVANYLLRRIESKHSEKRPMYELNKDVQVEHVMPKSYTKWTDPFLIDGGTEHFVSDSLPGEEDTLHEKYINRLGNLTLLDPQTNNEVSDEPFEKKLELFKKIPFQLTNSEHKIAVTAYSQWTAQSIELRQEKLAEIAAEIWSL